MELCRLLRGADFHRRVHFRAGQAGRSGATGGAFELQERHLERLQRCGQRAGVPPEASGQLEAQQKLVASLKEYARLAWLQYNGGYTPYLTVLDAESQLFPAELNYAQTRTSLLIAYVSIYQAMGGGWVNNAEMLTEAAAQEAHR